MIIEELNKKREQFLKDNPIYDTVILTRGYDNAVDTLWPEIESLEKQKALLNEAAYINGKRGNEYALACERLEKQNEKLLDVLKEAKDILSEYLPAYLQFEEQNKKLIEALKRIGESYGIQGTVGNILKDLGIE